MTLEQTVTAYLNILQQRTAEHYEATGLILQPPTYTLEPGSKYIKVVQNDRGRRSVHAFINKATADLYKPASWRGPVKDARYNLLRDLPILATKVDPYGSYLYKGAV